MGEIQELSSLFKGKDCNIIQENFITAEAWKSGIRKIQIKLTNFYTVKMRYFSTINESMELDLKLFELDEKEWAKSCISKMTGFCICGWSTPTTMILLIWRSRFATLAIENRVSNISNQTNAWITSSSIASKTSMPGKSLPVLPYVFVSCSDFGSYDS